jgi:hypothetical protein
VFRSDSVNQAPNSDAVLPEQQLESAQLDTSLTCNHTEALNTPAPTLDPELDTFIGSLAVPLQQPLLQDEPRLANTCAENTETNTSLDTQLESSTQRKSTRLAQKAADNVGKGYIQIAQELLVKKLGDLSGEEVTQNTTDFDYYAQYFQRPMEKNKMEAIKILIEEGGNKQKKGATLMKAATQVGLEA